MAALNATPAEDNAALEFLLNRRSCHQLTGPGPSDEELALMLRVALRTPDFGHLHPYRFLAARGDGLARLGQAMQRAAIVAGKPEKIVARAPGMPQRAPLVIVVVATPRVDKIVPEFDQLLCAACTVLMLQMAARSLGYGGVWRSGWMMYDASFHRELNLAEHERIVGFLYLGTPAAADEEAPPPADPFDYLSWI